jgi:hypothetical protein
LSGFLHSALGATPLVDSFDRSVHSPTSLWQEAEDVNLGQVRIPAGALFSSPGTLLTLGPDGYRSALPTQPPSSPQECGQSQEASTPMMWSAHIGLSASR